MGKERRGGIDVVVLGPGAGDGGAGDGAGGRVDVAFRGAVGGLKRWRGRLRRGRLRRGRLRRREGRVLNKERTTDPTDRNMEGEREGSAECVLERGGGRGLGAGRRRGEERVKGRPMARSDQAPLIFRFVSFRFIL